MDSLNSLVRLCTLVHSASASFIVAILSTSASSSLCVTMMYPARLISYLQSFHIYLGTLKSPRAFIDPLNFVRSLYPVRFRRQWIRRSLSPPWLFHPASYSPKSETERWSIDQLFDAFLPFALVSPHFPIARARLLAIGGVIWERWHRQCGTSRKYDALTYSVAIKRTQWDSNVWNALICCSLAPVWISIYDMLMIMQLISWILNDWSIPTDLLNF